MSEDRRFDELMELRDWVLALPEVPQYPSKLKETRGRLEQLEEIVRRLLQVMIDDRCDDGRR